TLRMSGPAAIVFGAAPAWQIAFIDPHQNLKQGRGTGEGSAGRHHFRSGLVVAELSLALVLLASAGVIVKSLAKLKAVDVGFRPRGLMTAALPLPERQYNTPDKQIAFLSSTLERLSNSPGIVSAAAGVPLPFSGFGGSASFRIEGRVAPPGDPGPHGDIRGVSPRYFETMGIRLLRGRYFTDQDRLGSQPVAIIDENLAHEYWPHRDALGQRFVLSMGPRRSAVTLLSVFAAMAMALAAVGLFGLIRFNVTQRTQEIGVRIALGASRGDVLRMVLGESLRLALLGVAGGLIA